MNRVSLLENDYVPGSDQPLITELTQLTSKIAQENIPVTLSEEGTFKIKGIVPGEILPGIVKFASKIKLCPKRGEELQEFLIHALPFKDFVVSINLEKMDDQEMGPHVAFIAERYQKVQGLQLKSKITKESLSSLTKLADLKSLSFKASKQVLIPDLSAFTHLSELRFSLYTNIRELPDLSPFKNLQIFKIFSCAKLHTIPNINALENLTTLSLIMCAIEGELELQKLKKLKNLEVSNCPKITALRLVQLKNLESIKSSGCANLLRLTMVVKNRMKDFELFDGGEISLTKKDTIYLVSFGFCNSVRKFTSINDDADPLIYPNLEELVLENPSHVESFNFTNTKIRAVTLKNIRSSKVDFSYTEIREVTLQNTHTLKAISFKGCQSLNELNIEDITVPSGFCLDLSDCDALEKARINTAALHGKIKLPRHLTSNDSCLIS